MMMGVAQVIGMKPILRFFFSSAPEPCAKASPARPSGKNCERAASAVAAPTDLRKARGAAREHGAHHRRGDDALVALVGTLHRHRLALERRHRPLVLGLADVAAADAAGAQPASGVERIVEGRHEDTLARSAPGSSGPL